MAGSATERPADDTATTPKRRKPAPADGAKRQPRGEARRQAILDAAIETLARKGQRGLRLTELAEGLGLKHSNLIYYFGSRERLLSEAVEEREKRERWFYKIPDEMVSLSELPDAAELIKENALFTRLYVVLAAESLDPEDGLHEFFVHRYRRARQRIMTAVMTDKEAGRIRPDVDAEQVGYEVISMMMGLEIQWLMDPDNVDYLQIMRNYTDGLYERFGTPEQT
ncbi:TetR/AcrR family transcriptional regulator [Thermomonospora umbrina]|uniref:TetR family transcriptional regulator n=1 Tax=Thermomonospora umbrina TaxID=111806 RepID=A0A3D9SXW0_9ACTN|nr:TetR/AcrR family transcriptional regulator [Thermomonospora umbrina]REF00787.1 TetR family transcriptional regulator [Thermomonospora umbrina]